jgi:rhodanese-related sulfurtransferase
MFLSPQQLVEIITTKKSGIDYAIIDVRDEDFHYGHIPGAFNIPAHEFLEKLDSEDSSLDYLNNIPMLIFHCALSQVRGPKCAQRYETRKGKQTFVLKGGFQTFGSLYKNNAVLVQDYDQEYWEEYS